MNKYEIAVLYDPDLEIDSDKATAKVVNIFKDNGGSVTKVDDWGKRKLAYPINKHDHAVYVFYSADIPPEGLAKIEAALNITDEVIRFLITRPDLKAIAKAEHDKAEKAKKAAERGEKTADDESEEEE